MSIAHVPVTRSLLQGHAGEKLAKLLAEGSKKPEEAYTHEASSDDFTRLVGVRRRALRGLDWCSGYWNHFWHRPRHGVYG